MTDTYRHTKICNTCKEEFKTLIGEYTDCIYCWYDKTYPKVYKYVSRLLSQ